MRFDKLNYIISTSMMFIQLHGFPKSPSFVYPDLQVHSRSPKSHCKQPVSAAAAPAVLQQAQQEQLASFSEDAKSLQVGGVRADALQDAAERHQLLMLLRASHRRASLFLRNVWSFDINTDSKIRIWILVLGTRFEKSLVFCMQCKWPVTSQTNHSPIYSETGNTTEHGLHCGQPHRMIFMPKILQQVLSPWLACVIFSAALSNT